MSSNRLWHLIKRGTQLTAGLMLFHDNVADLRWCEGASMLPTLNATGDLLLQRPLSKRSLSNHIDRGQLVNFISPMNPKVLACKRVIGLPGDRILLNGIPVDIPPGHLWLEGDNQTVSVDSRVYGPVPLGLVQGRILARVWPTFSWFGKPFEYRVDSSSE